MNGGTDSERVIALFDAATPLLRMVANMIHSAPLSDGEKLQAALMTAVAASFPAATLAALDPCDQWEELSRLVAKAARDMMPPDVRDGLRRVYEIARKVKREGGGPAEYGTEIAPILFETGLPEEEAADAAAHIWQSVQEEGQA